MTGRLPRLTRSELDDDQRQVYDSIVGGPRGSGPKLFQLVGDDTALEGPFNAMLFSPALGADLQRLGATVRYRTAFSPRAREIAVLLIAAAWHSAFETYSHEAIARSVGLDQAELAEVAAQRIPKSFDATETLIAEVVIALTQQHDLSDELHSRAQVALGDGGLVELTTLVGYYATLALLLRVFRVEAPVDRPEAAVNRHR